MSRNKEKKKEKGENKKDRVDLILSIALILAVGILSFAWSLHLKLIYAPDEYMRDDIAFWIAEHWTLPTGFEPILINKYWGHSYGFVPYLTSMIAAVFIKIAQILGFGRAGQQAAMRFVSVLVGMGTAWIGLKLGKELFKGRWGKFLFAGMISLVPQMIFLSSYLNNDGIAVAATLWIVYEWVKGIREGWTRRNLLGLGASIGLLALTYYNAYGIIPASIYVYFMTNKNEKKKVWKGALVVFLTAFAIAGWFFVRNALIHEGDFFGLVTLRKSAEMYALEEYKPSNYGTMMKDGYSILDLFTKTRFVELSFESFFAVFGHMEFYAEEWVYRAYGILYLPAAVIGLFSTLKDRKTRQVSIGLVMVFLIPIALNVYRSWSRDWQPQGRYIMPCIVPLVYWAVHGYGTLLKPFENKKLHELLYFLILLAVIVMLVIVFRDLILKSCWHDISEMMEVLDDVGGY